MTRRLSVALMAVGGSVLLAVALALVPRSWWGALASRWPVLVPVAVGLVVLVAGALLWRRDGVKPEVSAAPTPPDRQVRPLRSWVIPFGVVLVGAVTWAAVAWLQGSMPAVGDGVQRAQLRVESIRTGLTIGAAVTGAFALLLAFRRQQLAERTQQATEYDAGEKRVTELYVKAVDQLGADRAPVRLGGLYALERLAQDNPVHRQSIVEVICAYLRMPYTPPDDQPATASPSKADDDTPLPSEPATDVDNDTPTLDAREERQVRLTAQRILARHLQSHTRGDASNPVYWGPQLLDLTEAVLTDLDLTGCYLGNATFAKARFIGAARFDGASFGGDALFDGASFGGDARFDRASFGGDALFDGATFGGDARFDRATFGRYAAFEGASFDGRAGFGMARFGSNAGFSRATFEGRAWFGRASFGGHAGFHKASFGHAGFDEVSFDDEAWFGGASFTGLAWFDRVSFGGEAVFEGTSFGDEAWFGQASFGGGANFAGATRGGASYDGPVAE